MHDYKVKLFQEVGLWINANFNENLNKKLQHFQKFVQKVG